MAALSWGSGPSLLHSAVFSIILFVLTQQAIAAPVIEQQTTEIDSYTTEINNVGCYYNFQHYNEGDRILTYEPCLNCTCHKSMLMCYLRVCPFIKPIGQDCKIEKSPDQCCPVITCPEVPVQLLTSTTTQSPSTAGAQTSDIGHLDNYGCTLNNLFYSDGARVPSDPSKPCELCYCIRNQTTCVMQQCTLHVEGCKPVYQSGVCCPIRYDCDREEHDLLETTVSPTSGLLLTTTLSPGASTDCKYNDTSYIDGELIETESPCEHCYCMRGEIVCAVQECGKPMEKTGTNCVAVPKVDQCCPEYECETAITTTERFDIVTELQTENESVELETVRPVESVKHPEHEYKAENGTPEPEISQSSEDEHPESFPQLDESKVTTVDYQQHDKITEAPAEDHLVELTTMGVRRTEEQETQTEIVKESDEVTTSNIDKFEIPSETSTSTIDETKQDKVTEDTYSKGPSDIDHTVAIPSEKIPESSETIKDESQETSTATPIQSSTESLKEIDATTKEEEPTEVTSYKTNIPDEVATPVEEIPQQIAIEKTEILTTSQPEPIDEILDVVTHSQEKTDRMPESDSQVTEKNVSSTESVQKEEELPKKEHVPSDTTSYVESTTTMKNLETEHLTEKSDLFVTPQIPSKDEKSEDSHEIKEVVTTESTKHETFSTASESIDLTTSRVDETKSEPTEQSANKVTSSESPAPNVITETESSTVIEKEEDQNKHEELGNEIPSEKFPAFELTTAEPHLSTGKVEVTTISHEIEISSKGAEIQHPTEESNEIPGNDERKDLVTEAHKFYEDHSEVTERTSEENEIQTEIGAVPPLTEIAPEDEIVTTKEPFITNEIQTEIDAVPPLTEIAPEDEIDTTKPFVTNETQKDIGVMPSITEIAPEDKIDTTKQPFTTNKIQTEQSIEPEISNEIDEAKPQEDSEIKKVTTEKNIEDSEKPKVTELIQETTSESISELQTSTPEEKQSSPLPDMFGEGGRRKVTTTTAPSSERQPEYIESSTSGIGEHSFSTETTTKEVSESEITENPKLSTVATPEKEIHKDLTETVKNEEPVEIETPETTEKADTGIHETSDEVDTEKHETSDTEVPETSEKVDTEKHETSDTEVPETSEKVDTEIHESTSEESSEILPEISEEGTELPQVIEFEHTTTEIPEIIKETTEISPVKTRPEITTGKPEIEMSQDKIEQTEKDYSADITESPKLVQPTTSEILTEKETEQPKHDKETSVIEEINTEKEPTEMVKEIEKVNIPTEQETEKPEVIKPDFTSEDSHSIEDEIKETQTTEIQKEKETTEKPEITEEIEKLDVIKEDTAKPTEQPEIIHKTSTTTILETTQYSEVVESHSEHEIKGVHSEPTERNEISEPFTSQTPISLSHSDDEIKEVPVATEKVDVSELFTSQTPTESSSKPIHDVLSSEYPSISQRIPGEGDCLIGEITYRNNSFVPSSNSCQLSCKCLSSIVKCIMMECSPPPSGMKICQPVFHGTDDCCPTYNCEAEEAGGPLSDSQMKETTPTEKPSPELQNKFDLPSVTETQQIETETKMPVESIQTQKPEEEEITSADKVSSHLPTEASIAESTSKIEEVSSESTLLKESTPTVPESETHEDVDKLDTIAHTTHDESAESDKILPTEYITIAHTDKPEQKPEIETQATVSEDNIPVSISEATSTEQVKEEFVTSASTSVKPDIDTETSEKDISITERIDSNEVQQSVDEEQSSEIEKLSTEKSSEYTTEKPELSSVDEENASTEKHIKLDDELKKETETEKEQQSTEKTIFETSAKPQEDSSSQEKESDEVEKPSVEKDISQSTESSESASSESGKPDISVISTDIPEIADILPESSTMHHIEISTKLPVETDLSTEKEEKPEIPKINVPELESNEIPTEAPTTEDSNEISTDKVTELPSSEEHESQKPTTSSSLHDEVAVQQETDEKDVHVPTESDESIDENKYDITTKYLIEESSTHSHEEHNKMSTESAEPSSSEESVSVDLEPSVTEKSEEKFVSVDQNQFTTKPSISSTESSSEEITSDEKTTSSEEIAEDELTTVTTRLPSSSELSLQEVTTSSESIETSKTPTESHSISTEEVVSSEETSSSYTPSKEPEDEVVEKITASSEIEKVSQESTEKALSEASTVSSSVEIPSSSELPVEDEKEVTSESHDIHHESSSTISPSLVQIPIEQTERAPFDKNELPTTTQTATPDFISSQQPSSSTIAPGKVDDFPTPNKPSYPTNQDDFPQMPQYPFPETDEYDDEETTAFGPGTCRYGGKVYVSAQQIPRDDPCDFCFCFRSDIICLQQSCPPPIPKCREEPIQGFCCPRYECPVSMATVLNMTTTTTTTTTTLPPHFLHHAYRGAATRRGCQLEGKAYNVGEVVKAKSGPCLQCTCGGDGQMKCDPLVCRPQPMIQQMIAAAATRRRR